MKFQAHPLVVAAALGLIGPGALAEEEEPEAEALWRGFPTSPPPGVPSGDPDGRLDPVPLGVEPVAAGEWTWAPSAAPDAEAFHRVELAWLKESQGR